MRRRTRFNDSSAELVAYLDRKYSLTHADIAAMLSVSISFVGRVAKAEREFEPMQTAMIADKIGVPMGEMLIDASPTIGTPTPERQAMIDLCERLMRLADTGIAAVNAERLKKLA